jgi:hypothetical protein
MLKCNVQSDVICSPTDTDSVLILVAWISYHHSIKQPNKCTFNVIFIALSRRHRSTCFGHCCAHHQEPPLTAFVASGYHMIAGFDVQPGNHKVKHVQPGNHTVTRGYKGRGAPDVERCLRDKAINIRLIVHLVGCFIEYLKMYGTTNPKSYH